MKLCDHDCNDMNKENYEKMYDFIQYIARDYIENSDDKVRIQRDDYIRMAKNILDELK